MQVLNSGNTDVYKINMGKYGICNMRRANIQTLQADYGIQSGIELREGLSKGAKMNLKR